MNTPPRISIVTPSFNQGRFIQETIESVLIQDYPNMEHIVVDGMSADPNFAILDRYNHLVLVREPDSGLADALNKGFALATGDILTFLNSGDTLLPGALHTVAGELSNTEEKQVILGRCRLVDSNGEFVGVEHPSQVQNHRKVLEIWKGHCIRQPAVFWSREAWERTGRFDPAEQLLPDYDLFCRLSRHYTFHFVDRVLAAYRLREESKTTSVSDLERLRRAIQVSRRHWGTPLSLLYWQLAFSYSLFRFNRCARALSHFRRGRDMWRRGHRFAAIGHLTIGTILAPDNVLDVVIIPAMKPRVASAVRRLRRPPRKPALSPSYPQTLAWKHFVAQHADGWVGPRFHTLLQIEPSHTHIRLEGSHGTLDPRSPLQLDIYLDDRRLTKTTIKTPTHFSLKVPLENRYPGTYQLRINSSSYFVPRHLEGNDDYRPLSFKIEKLELVSGS